MDIKPSRKSSTSPTQRSLKKLKAEGWLCAIVEKYNSFIKVRQDLYGFGDILAVRKGGETMIVQTTSGSNFAARMAKIKALPAAAIWHCPPVYRTIMVHGWRKVGARGAVKRWECREELVTL